MPAAPIPPDDAAWLSELAAEVARVLFGTATPAGSALERVNAAAEAASWIAARYIGLTAGDPPATVLPVAAEVRSGVLLLAVRVFHDPASPAGSLASDAYTGVYVPEDLLTHVRHYLDPWRPRAAGIA